MWFYVDKSREQRGPVSVDELKALLARDEITKRSYIWQEGRAEWTRLEDLASELGIKLIAPPPTPAATMVMQRAPMQPIPAAAPPAPMPAPVAAPPPAFQAPPAAAAPAFAPPQAYQAAPPNVIPMPQAGPPQPAYPQAPAAFPPYAAAPVRSGSNKWVGMLFSVLAFGFAVAYIFRDQIPALVDFRAKRALESIVSDMEPARSEVKQVFEAKKTCPGKDLALEAEITSDVFEDYTYGEMDTGSECGIQIDLPKDHPLKPIAGSRVLFVLRDGAWLCGMSAPAKYLPAKCDQIEIE